MQARTATLWFTVAACGRVEFDPRADGAASPQDAIACARGEYCREATPTTEHLEGVWARTATDVWAVGVAGTVLRRIDGVWTQLPSNTTNRLVSVWAAPDADVSFAVGENATMIRFTGDSPASMMSGGPFLSAVWGVRSDHVYAAGSAGTVSHWDGSTWNPVSGLVGELSSIWGSASPDDVWIGSIGSDLFHSQAGGAFTNVDPPPTADTWTAGWSSSSTDVWAAGEALSHYNGATWTTIDTTGFLPFEAGFGVADRAWLASAGDGLSVWNGATVSHQQSGITERINGIHGSDGVVWLVGDGGAIYVHRP